jgi:hypothetical protein
MANIKMLEKTLDVIKANKKRWDQGMWRGLIDPKARKKVMEDPNATPACGTAMCFAGWAVSLDRGRWAVSDKTLFDLTVNYEENGEWDPRLAYEDKLIARKSEIEAGLTDMDNGKHYISVEQRARNVLGLTQREANVLFSGDNNLSDLNALVKKLKKGEDITEVDD